VPDWSGNVAVRREFVEAHCRHLHRWYDAQGRWRDAAPAPDSRETLWHATSLLSRGADDDLRLASRVVRRMPMEYNGFTPVIAADILLHHDARLDAATRKHLLDVLGQYIVYVIEWRFAGDGLMNVAAMDSYCMLAASRVLKDGYRFEHRYAAAPCVYNSHRLETLALNGARLLDYGHSRGQLTGEYNSPTYTPITLMALAKMVEATEPGSATHELALRAEQVIWRETLAFYHPNLGVSTGPYSRAYLADITGQLSLLRALLCYVDIGHDRSVPKLIDEPHPDLVLHHLGNRPFTWANVAWLLTTRYHLPRDARPRPLTAGKTRSTQGIAHWSPFGRKVNDRFMPVQGDLLAGGSTQVVQHQRAHWSVGWHTRMGMTGINYPIHLHYGLKPRVRSMMDVRHVTCGIVLQDRHEPYLDGAYGQPAQRDIIQQAGDVTVTGSQRKLNFVARPLHRLSVLPTSEWSVNTLITSHFTPIANITLDGQRYDGTPIERRAREVCCRVEEAGFAYEIRYRASKALTLRLLPWGKFVRLAAFWYEGPRRMLSERTLRSFVVRGSLSVLAVR
jgi:hypothetical protein